MFPKLASIFDKYFIPSVSDYSKMNKYFNNFKCQGQNYQFTEIWKNEEKKQQIFF